MDNNIEYVSLYGTPSAPVVKKESKSSYNARKKLHKKESVSMFDRIMKKV